MENSISLAAGTVFEERQSFRQKWLWLVLIGTAVATFMLVPNPFGMEEQIAIGAVVTLVILGLFGMMSLHTRIDATGIQYQFYPFHWSAQVIRWDEIQRAEVRQYSPIMEYGGWGMRYTFGNGRAYNVSGNMGIQLVLKNDKKILLGTLRPEEAAAVLKQYFLNGH